jgi:hypothetical protein
MGDIHPEEERWCAIQICYGASTKFQRVTQSRIDERAQIQDLLTIEILFDEDRLHLFGGHESTDLSGNRTTVFSLL